MKPCSTRSFAPLDSSGKGRPPAPCLYALSCAGFCGCWVFSGALWLRVPAPLILPAARSFLALLSPSPFLSHTTPWVSLTHLVHGRDLLRYAMVRPYILAHLLFLGALGKEDLLLSLPPRIWNCSETHLSTLGIQDFSRRMRSKAHASNRQLCLLPGPPVPLRAGSQTAGTWSGVLQCSSTPARALNLPWPQQEFTFGAKQAGWRSRNLPSIFGDVLQGLLSMALPSLTKSSSARNWPT